MEPELLLDQGVLLGPIFMDQDRLIQTEREHLRLKVHNLAMVLQVQVPIERQNILSCRVIRDPVTCSKL